MKIAFLSTFYPFRGGIAQFNASMYLAFKAAGHEVKAFTFSRQYPDFLFPGETQYVTEADDAEVIESVPVLDTINPFSYLSTAKQINEYNPDLLLLRFWMPFFGPALGTVARKIKSSIKIVTLVDNLIPHERRLIDKPFTKYLVSVPQGYVVMTDSVKQDVLKVVGSKAPILLQNHPIHDQFGEMTDKQVAREKLGLTLDKKILLFFGFIRDYKGLDLLLEAFKELNEEYQLVIAGESYGSFESYQATIDQHPLKDQIKVFNRYISDQEVTTFFGAADVSVLPYKTATQSGITAVSFHFETPVISTDVGGLKETIKHGKTGLIVDQPVPEKIAKSIRDFFRAYSLTEFERNIQQQKKIDSWGNFCARIVDFANEIV